MLDNHITGPMECEHCGKICQGEQGLRGHSRGCPGFKPMVEPGKSLVRASNQQISLGTRLDVTAAEVVIGIHEPVRTFREQLRDALLIRRLSDSAARAHKYPTYGDWYDMAMDVARLELATERILQQARVSRDEPWVLHQLAITVRDRWVLWRREEAVRYWKQRASQK